MERRPLPTWSVLLVALVLAGLAGVATAQPAARTVMEQQMTPEEFKAAGLHKLSPQELAALHDWIRRQPHAAAPDASAASAPASAGPLPAGAATLSAAEVERIREQAREEGRQEVKEENRGFFDFGSDEPITSTLVGEFRGFAKGNRYTLENGQVWEQLEPARLTLKKTNPPVTIKPGILNVWFLRVDGYNTAAKVRRVK